MLGTDQIYPDRLGDRTLGLDTGFGLGVERGHPILIDGMIPVGLGIVEVSRTLFFP